MKVAKYKVNEYRTTVRCVVERTADNLRIGTVSMLSRDLDLIDDPVMIELELLRQRALPLSGAVAVS